MSYLLSKKGVPALAMVLMALNSSCAPEPKKNLHPVGSVFTLMPAAVNTTQPLRHPWADTKAIHFTVGWGGRPIATDKGNPRLRFYRNHSRNAGSDLPWSWFESAWKSTGCDSDEIALLNGPMDGVAMVCDGSISLSDVTLIDAVDDEGTVRTSTSWSTYLMADGVMGVLIQLY